MLYGIILEQAWSLGRERKIKQTKEQIKRTEGYEYMTKPGLVM